MVLPHFVLIQYISALKYCRFCNVVSYNPEQVELNAINFIGKKQLQCEKLIAT